MDMDVNETGYQGPPSPLDNCCASGGLLTGPDGRDLIAPHQDIRVA